MLSASCSVRFLYSAISFCLLGFASDDEEGANGNGVTCIVLGFA
jgi:hypothetical protein